jgi:hypothetical protein
MTNTKNIKRSKMRPGLREKADQGRREATEQLHFHFGTRLAQFGWHSSVRVVTEFSAAPSMVQA